VARVTLRNKYPTTLANINSFCKKHGFKRYEQAGMEVDGEWFGNYRLDI
jgi:hypothetical protein